MRRKMISKIAFRLFIHIIHFTIAMSFSLCAGLILMYIGLSETGATFATGAIFMLIVKELED